MRREEAKRFAIVFLDGVLGVEARHFLVRIDGKQDVSNIGLKREK